MTGGLGSNILIAIIASLAAILIFQGVQSAFFSEVVRDSKLGSYTTRYLSIRILNITNDYVEFNIENDGQTCKLRERESCYSRCYKVTVYDIKAGSADIEIVDEITCEIGNYASYFGEFLKDNFLRILGKK